MFIRHVTLTLATSAVVLTGVAVGAQSIRVGVPATEATASQPLILREFLRPTGQPVSTIDAGVVVGARKLLAEVGDIALIEPARMALPARLRPDTDSPTLRVSMVTVNALRVLGIKPDHGRDFSERDPRNQVAIAVAGVWQKHFAGQTLPRVYRDNPDATVLPLVVIGALPPGALSVNPELDPDTDLLVLSSNRLDQASADDRWFAPILRLKPGVSLTAAQSALDLALTTAPGRRAADGRPVHGVRLETLRR